MRRLPVFCSCSSSGEMLKHRPIAQAPVTGQASSRRSRHHHRPDVGPFASSVPFIPLCQREDIGHRDGRQGRLGPAYASWYTLCVAECFQRAVA